MDRAIEKIWEKGLTRSDVIRSKFAGGDSPEPLTDYMDVSWCFFAHDAIVHTLKHLLLAKCDTYDLLMHR